MGPFGSRKGWGERAHGNRKLFVVFVQIICDKIVCTLKITSLVASPAHAVLLDISLKKRAMDCMLWQLTRGIPIGVL